MKTLTKIPLIILFLASGLVSSKIRPLWAQDQGLPSDDQQQAGSTAADQGSSGPSSQSALPTDVTSPDYVIGPEDLLTIDVFNLPEMKQTVRVENDGMISVRLLGPVRAEGLTTLQLKHELQKDWGRDYLQDPQVSIYVKSFHSRPVSLIGDVVKPGLYQLPGPRSLIQVLAMAGGLRKSTTGGPGAGSYLYVTRKTGFDKLEPMDGTELVAPDKLKIDVKKLLAENDEEGPNIAIKPNDEIVIPRAGVVFVVGGGVVHPQKMILADQDNITVMQALAVCQGLAPNAAGSHAKIIRRSQTGALTEVPINISEIFKGKSPDPPLGNNDVLFVPGSGAKAFGKSSVTMAIGTIAAWIIWH